MRYSGIIGYCITHTVDFREIEEWVERKYKGDILSTNESIQSGSASIDSMIIRNSISIVADPYARDNWSFMRYAEYMGKMVKIESAQLSLDNKRIILSLGGLYNGRYT